MRPIDELDRIAITVKSHRLLKALLKENPRHPSVRLKKVGDFWSARVGSVYRALAVEDEKGFIWVWMGAHDEYEEIIKRR